MKPFLSVYGHISIDQILSLNEFPQMNTSVDVVSKQTKLGGTGTNIAVMAAALGVPTAICGFVGTDFPKMFEDFMVSKGLIMDEMVKVEMETSQAIVVNDANLDQKVLFFQGPQGYATQQNMLLTKNAKQSKFTHFCTGEPKYYIQVMKEIKGKDNLIGLDPAQEVHRIWNADLFNEAYHYSDMLFCNQFEAKSVMRFLRVDSFDQVNFPFIVCTKGKDGCEVYIDGKAMRFPIVKAKRTIDATGAGDSFRAGFYAGQYHGLSLEQSIITAAATSSFVVEEVGALSNIPTWDMVMERADPLLSKV
ncbi:MAG: carbohydrate kinase [Candidatus Methanomethylophilaceae archaeon]|nr:carbohydrate kinase [Candidatus Methanomethylophilaceae archaeon]